ncbi:hypothetical protein MSVAZ_3064 [Methanosarcina vacuolata Z-761]|uniref:Uncharacterized protein n=1 Tax=Methanosarcina vacuolata Z-761 TaxID=1434123 RepID=A0A0E3Q6T3_9EURY|nr:hypothetical protein MSVAZ_3064 [Methanosarcina vacuolata Z-761]
MFHYFIDNILMNTYFLFIINLVFFEGFIAYNRTKIIAIQRVYLMSLKTYITKVNSFLGGFDYAVDIFTIFRSTLHRIFLPGFLKQFSNIYSELRLIYLPEFILHNYNNTIIVCLYLLQLPL